MPQQRLAKANRQQIRSLHRLFLRNADHTQDWRAFRRRAVDGYDNVLFIRWSGMIIGIEPDGYAHS